MVVNFEGEAYLEACIRSLQAQSLPIAELIVVENASTDGSLNLLNSQFRGVEIVRMVENVGACTARNVGMRAAKYRWVLLVDNDVVLAEDTLEHLAAAVSAEDGAVMVKRLWRGVTDAYPIEAAFLTSAEARKLARLAAKPGIAHLLAGLASQMTIKPGKALRAEACISQC